MVQYAYTLHFLDVRHPPRWQKVTDLSYRTILQYQITGICLNLMHFQSIQERSAINMEISKIYFAHKLGNIFELILYSRAASLEEYMDLTTLEKRVHYLFLSASKVITSTIEPATLDIPAISDRRTEVYTPLSVTASQRTSLSFIVTTSFVTLPAPSSSKRRSSECTWILETLQQEKLQSKRLRRNTVSDIFIEPERYLSSRRYCDGLNGILAMRSFQELGILIYSYLSFIEIVELLGLTKNTYLYLPLAMTHIALPLEMIEYFLQTNYMQQTYSIFKKLKNVQSLQITNRKDQRIAKEEKVMKGGKMIRTLQFSKEFLKSFFSIEPFKPATTKTVESSLQTFLSLFFQQSNCMQLKSLYIKVPYLNTCHFYGWKCLTKILAKESLPNLESLYLGKHNLGDTGCIGLATLFREEKLCKVKVLNLRENFIEYDGIVALYEAFQQLNGKCQLEMINLNGNILMENSINLLKQCMQYLPKIQKILVKNTFSSYEVLLP